MFWHVGRVGGVERALCGIGHGIDKGLRSLESSVWRALGGIDGRRRIGMDEYATLPFCGLKNALCGLVRCHRRRRYGRLCLGSALRSRHRLPYHLLGLRRWLLVGLPLLLVGLRRLWLLCLVRGLRLLVGLYRRLLRLIRLLCLRLLVRWLAWRRIWVLPRRYVGALRGRHVRILAIGRIR